MTKWRAITYHLGQDNHVEKKCIVTFEAASGKRSKRDNRLYETARQLHAEACHREGIIVNPSNVGVMELERD